MHEIILFMGTVIMGFFAIMNPIANTPIFLGLTSDIKSRKIKNAIAIKSTLFAFVIVSVFVVLGHFIFRAFGITLPAFQITGGILLFVIGVEMLKGQSSSFHHKVDSKENEEEETKSENPQAAMELAISPLGIPILAGPGTIAAAMNFTGIKSGVSHVVQPIVVILAFALICLVTFLMFISANRIVDLLGKQVISVISRIMGLILAVIATQMVIIGIKNAIAMYQVSS